MTARAGGTTACSDLVLKLLDGIVFERPLDAACGDGALAALLRRGTRGAFGTDRPATGLGEAARRHPDVSIARALPFEQPFRAGTFDLVVRVAADGLPEPQRSAFELRRTSSRYVILVVPGRPPAAGGGEDPGRGTGATAGAVSPAAPPAFFDQERLLGLVTGAGLRVLRIERASPPADRGLSGGPAGSRERSAGLAGSLGRIARGLFGAGADPAPRWLGVLAERVATV